MDENFELSAEIQEAAEPVEEVSDNAEVTGEISGERQEVAEPAASGRTDADRAFAELRRKYQEAQSEAEDKNAQLQSMISSFNKFGFTGSTPGEIADAIAAHTTGRDINEIRTERESREAAEREIRRAKAEAEYYRMAEVQRRMDRDLRTIQKIDPTVKSLEELGEDFLGLIRNGISGEVAFNAVRAKEGRTEKKEPPKIGAVNSRTTEEKEYYTNDELDALTSKDLDNPKILAKAIKSLGRLRS